MARKIASFGKGRGARFRGLTQPFVAIGFEGREIERPVVRMWLEMGVKTEKALLYKIPGHGRPVGRKEGVDVAIHQHLPDLCAIWICGKGIRRPAHLWLPRLPVINQFAGKDRAAD